MKGSDVLEFVVGFVAAIVLIFITAMAMVVVYVDEFCEYITRDDDEEDEHGR